MMSNEESALYFLVWHVGMKVPEAKAAMEADRACIRPLARAGRYESMRCLNALAAWIDKVTK